MRFAAFLLFFVISLILIINNNESGKIMGLHQYQFASFSYFFVILIFFAPRFLSEFKNNLGKTTKQLLIWCGVFILFMFIYALREEFKSASRTFVGELSPGTSVIGTEGEVVITQDSNKNFLVRAEVNGKYFSFIFDTGADYITLTHETAQELGFHLSEADYAFKMYTANGVTHKARIVIDNFSVGTIQLGKIIAYVSQKGALTENLLGRNFLDRLDSYEVRGRKLIFRKAL